MHHMIMIPDGAAIAQKYGVRWRPSRDLMHSGLVLHEATKRGHDITTK